MFEYVINDSVKNEVMKKWFNLVFGAAAGDLEGKDNLRFKNPLLYEAAREFPAIYDFAVSGTPAGGSVPVARSLIRYRALNMEKKGESMDNLSLDAVRDVIRYPIDLREALVVVLTSNGQNELNSIEIILNIFKRIDELFLAAAGFLLKTREDIYKIKLDELKTGLFANETGGCPSGFLQNMS